MKLLTVSWYVALMGRRREAGTLYFSGEESKAVAGNIAAYFKIVTVPPNALAFAMWKGRLCFTYVWG